MHETQPLPGNLHLRTNLLSWFNSSRSKAAYVTGLPHLERCCALFYLIYRMASLMLCLRNN